MLVTDWKRDDMDYFKTHPETTQNYVLAFYHDVFICKSFELEKGFAVFNGEYETALDDQKTSHFLVMEGMEDVLNGYMMTLTSIHSCSVDETEDGSYEFGSSSWGHDDLDVIS